jgi:hypothetical protein
VSSVRANGRIARARSSGETQTGRLGRIHPCPKFGPPMRQAGQRARPPLSSLWPTCSLLSMRRIQHLMCPKPLPAFSTATPRQRRRLQFQLPLASAVPSGRGGCRLPVVGGGCRADYVVDASCLAGSCLPRRRRLLLIPAHIARVVCALSSTPPGGVANLLRAQSLAGSLAGAPTTCWSGRHSEFKVCIASKVSSLPLQRRGNKR